MEDTAALMAHLVRTQEDPAPLEPALQEAALTHPDEDMRYSLLSELVRHAGACDSVLARAVHSGEVGLWEAAMSPALGPELEVLILSEGNEGDLTALAENPRASAEALRELAEHVPRDTAGNPNLPPDLVARFFERVNRRTGECSEDCLCTGLARRSDLSDSQASSLFGHELAWLSLAGNDGLTRGQREAFLEHFLRNEVVHFNAAVALAVRASEVQAEAMLASRTRHVRDAACACPELSAARQLELSAEDELAHGLLLNPRLARSVQLKYLEGGRNTRGLSKLEAPEPEVVEALFQGHPDAFLRNPRLDPSQVTRLVVERGEPLPHPNAFRVSSCTELRDDLPASLVGPRLHGALLIRAQERGVELETLSQLLTGWSGTVDELLTTCSELGPRRLAS